MFFGDFHPLFAYSNQVFFLACNVLHSANQILVPFYYVEIYSGNSGNSSGSWSTIVFRIIAFVNSPVRVAASTLIHPICHELFAMTLMEYVSKIVT